MERIKDFFYDISDLLISLLIIAVIFMVISWKLNESIPIDSTLAPQTVDEPAAAPDAAVENPDGVKLASDSPDLTADASDADKPIAEQPAANTAPKPASVKEITIKIPSGSPGVAIGKILKENGLITDISAFIKKVDEMGVGPKLRSGSFKLKTGMSLESIIKVIANMN